MFLQIFQSTLEKMPAIIFECILPRVALYGNLNDSGLLCTEMVSDLATIRGRKIHLYNDELFSVVHSMT